MTPLERIRIEKAAADCGFERTITVDPDGAWVLSSSLFSDTLRLWANTPAGFRIEGSTDSTTAQNIDELYEILLQFAAKAKLQVPAQAELTTINDGPQSTDAQRWTLQRVGQDRFRNALLEYWKGHCCVTGLAVTPLLRASHIKPWAACETDAERLNVFNGLLLAPHVDALFDGGWISFSDDGSVLISEDLPREAYAALGLSLTWNIRGLRPEHAAFLTFHRQFVLKKSTN